MPYLLLLAATVFLGLHAVHLTADFPNHSPWMDWAKYTDEGWYGDAAIRHYQRGHWYVYGDFNPAAALPIWPLLEFAVFRVTGVSLVAARGLTVATFGLILVFSYLLLRRWQADRTSLVPAAAVLLLAVSPFCFVFTRMAILEPLLILLTLMALLAASNAPNRLHEATGSRLHYHFPTVLLGILLPLMVLTKTTAVFLFPCVFWMLWGAAGYRLRPFLRTALLAIGIGAALWASYFFLFVRPHFLDDYRYLFSANAYTKITLATAREVLHETLRDGIWIGRTLYGLTVTASAATLLLLRRRTPPLVVSLLLWVAGYTAFLAYHNNLQPRYYLVVAVPMTLLLPLTLSQLVHRLSQFMPSVYAAAGAVATLTVASIILHDAVKTVRYVRTPEYTFVNAAARVREIVKADSTHNPLILSISGSELSLMTGLPSICDDFGTMELSERVKTYRPGWYISWNQVDDDKMEALAEFYRLDRVAAIPAMDDPDRNLLIVYRLDPPQPGRLRPRRTKALTPKLLDTGMGQQRAATHLLH